MTPDPEDWSLYRTQDVDELVSECTILRSECIRIVDRYTRHSFRSSRAHQFAAYGLGRRLYLLRHCVGRVFDLLPPSSTTPPDEGHRHDAEAFLHAFIINVYGCIENLAHIWVNESCIKRAGKPLPNSAVTFTNNHVKQSLTGDLRGFVLEDVSQNGTETTSNSGAILSLTGYPHISCHSSI